jgi:hypothetical protein
MERLAREESDLIVFSLAYLLPSLSALNSAGSDPRAGGKSAQKRRGRKKLVLPNQN